VGGLGQELSIAERIAHPRRPKGVFMTARMADQGPALSERLPSAERKLSPMAIRGARPTTSQIAPHLIVRDGQRALAFYKQAFGATELYRSEMPSGLGLHAQLQIAESVVLISTENLQQHPEGRVRAPEALAGTCVLLELYVDDVDAWFERAVAAGGTPTIQPADTFFGDPYSWVTDPFGHIWSLATVKEVLTAE
jgi:PhnB protein